MSIKSRKILIFIMLLMSKTSMAMHPNAEKIGSGVFGKVYKVYLPSLKSVVAVKHITVEEKDPDLDYIEREIKIIEREIKIAESLSSTDHPNIVKYLDSHSDGLSHYVYFEHLRSNLENSLRNDNPLRMKLKWILGLIAGIDFIHDEGIIHGDLKPANLLLTDSNQLKICDFGLAHNIDEDLHLYKHGEIYTLWYRAPEIMLGDENQATDAHWYNEKIDIWAFGLIAYQILTGKALLPGYSEYDQMMKIFQLSGTPSEENWVGVSKFAHFRQDFPFWGPSLDKKNEEIYLHHYHLFYSQKQNNLFWSILLTISECLTLDPSQRPTAKQLRTRLEKIIHELIWTGC